MFRGAKVETELDRSWMSTHVQDAEGYKLTERGQAREPGVWQRLCAALATLTDVDDLPPTAGDKTQVAVTALAAWRGDNRLVLAQISLLPEARSLRKRGQVDLDMQKVSEEALRVCISSGDEWTAVDLLPSYQGSIPQYLIHRAGEHYMLKLLAAIVQLALPLRPNRALASIHFRLSQKLSKRQSPKRPRFDMFASTLDSGDVLKWACIGQKEQGVLDFLALQLDINDEVLVDILIDEELQNTVEQFVRQKRVKLTEAAMDSMIKNGHISVAAELLQVTSTQKTMTTLRFKSPKSLRSYRIIQSLIRAVSRPKDCLCAYFLLLYTQREDWTTTEFDRMDSALTSLIAVETVEQSCLCNHCNPLLVLVAASELSLKLSTFSLLHREKFVSYDTNLREIAQRIQSQYKDYHSLKIMYIDKSFGGRSLLDLLVRNTERYRGLLKCELVVAIVEDLWSGGDIAGVSFYQLTSVSAYFDDFEGEFFNIHSAFSPSLATKSIFQFHYWKHNGTIRLIIETLALLIVFIIMVTSLIMYLDIVQIFESPAPTTAELNYATETLNLLMSLNDIYMTVCAMLMVFTIQKTVYKLLLGESAGIGLRELLDTSLFVVSLAIKKVGSTKEIQRLIGDQEQVFAFQEILYSTMFLLCTIRLSTILLQTRLFGPVLRMMFVIVKDVIVFFVIYALLIVSFALLFVPLFRRDGEYFGSIQLGVRTLFQWSVGGIDPTVFTYRPELGSALTVVWALVSTVIVLNVLIAMLSSRYEELAPQVTSDYVSILYQSYTQTRYEPPFGGLVMAPPPFNCVHWALMLPYALFPKSARVLDPIAVMASYQLMFGAGLLVFLCYSAVLAAGAYWVALCRYLSARGWKWRSALHWVFIGPFYLCFLVTSSTRYYWSSMYYDYSEEGEVDSIPDEVFSPVSQFLDRLHSPTSQATVRLPLSDLVPSVSKISHHNPPKAAKTCETQPFSGAVGRFPQAKGSVSVGQKRRILEFFEQFASYSETAPPAVNLTRMATMLKDCENNRKTLKPVNISYAMRAVIEQTKKNRKIK